eukprot:1236247-Pyramimonas_sp.AAC.1
MEAIFRTLKRRWASLNARRSGPYYGIVIDGPSEPLTNLRFADDVLLACPCKRDVSRMIVGPETEARKHGLKLHMGKTVVLANAGERPLHVQCRGTRCSSITTRGSREIFEKEAD